MMIVMSYLDNPFEPRDFDKRLQIYTAQTPISQDVILFKLEE